MSNFDQSKFFKLKGFTFFPKKAVAERSEGFTLIELMIAIVIITVLSTVGIASFNGISRSNAIQQQAQEIKSLARKLRSDATAAVKPSGNCSLPANNASIYGTYLYFKNNTSTYYYGVACFNPTTSTSYSTVSQADLKSPLLFNFAGGNDYMALLYTFNGQVASYTFNTGGAPVIAIGDFALPLLFERAGVSVSIQEIIITDGTASRNYRINFSPTGLVCEEKASITAFCAD